MNATVVSCAFLPELTVPSRTRAESAGFRAALATSFLRTYVVHRAIRTRISANRVLAAVLTRARDHAPRPWDEHGERQRVLRRLASS